MTPDFKFSLHNVSAVVILEFLVSFVVVVAELGHNAHHVVYFRH